ncbi:hypothetical protein BC834DRAFT_896725 [Gloeopeniophorella convolvens]|nr:hypothetical protein BC834DRAFT_896725 [Gloeopeniophorella convolvens]
MPQDTKVALVTGAARACPRWFDVAVNDLPDTPELDQLAKEIEQKGQRSFAVPADVSLEPQVEKMIQDVVQELGSLDVMVANAGIIIYESVLEGTVENFDRLMAVNARSTMLCYKHAGKQMIAQSRGGRIIGIVVHSNRSNILSSYSASKFAIRGLTHAAARELGKYGITVNAYAPGATDTRFLDGLKTLPQDKIGSTAVGLFELV